MGFLGKLFGGAGGKALTAREALAQGREALTNWSAPKSEGARLWSVHTLWKQAKRGIKKDGRCRGWGVDFYLEHSRSFYFLRIVDGRVKGRERPLSEAFEDVDCSYGAQDGEGEFVGGAKLPADWIDSDSAAALAFQALEREMAGVDRCILNGYILLGIVLTAGYLRYAKRGAAAPALTQSPPTPLSYGVLLGHTDFQDHDALAVNIDAVTGQETEADRFTWEKGGLARIS